MGPALSRVLLEQVAEGRRGPVVRIARTGRAIAFGRRDCVSPGYAAARRIGSAHDYPGIERLSGGRATAYGEGVVVLTFTVPDPAPVPATAERFQVAADLTRDALMRLGVDARIGQIADEYCPGEFSISAAGRTKLAGIGQRMVKGAAHVGVVITASGNESLAAILQPVYAALGMPLDPATIGSVEDEIGRSAAEDLTESITHQLGRRTDLIPAELDQPTLETARSMAARFRSPP
jgi:octanoyl-[GcvH]:protein N-octanoyltransferase